MGLDMYLKSEQYLWDEESDGLVEQIKSQNKHKLRPTSIRYDAIYWRKANHIHKWFVDNVQNGNDDCKDYYLSLKTLLKLREVCYKVLDERNEELSKKLLPTYQGCFYGSYEYDDYYYDAVRYTANSIDNLVVIRGFEKMDLIYYSSW